MAISERKELTSSPDYFPILPDCWAISRIPLPENYTLMAAFVLPETSEVIGAAKDATETLFLMRYDLSGKQAIQFTRLYSESGQKITRCSISRNYIAAVINKTTIKVWDFKARPIDCQENIIANTAIAFLDIHQLICFVEGGFTIRNVEEHKSTKPYHASFLVRFEKLNITQNKFIVLSSNNETVFYKPGQGHVATKHGQFLCETPTEFVITQCQQQNIYFNRYDKDTLKQKKDIRVPLLEQGRHNSPVATPLPMGWINLITTYRIPAKEAESKTATHLYIRQSTILNQALEPIAQKTLCQSTNIHFSTEIHSSFKGCELVNSQSTIPASITSNGDILGQLHNHCLRWQHDPLHTQKPADVAQLLEFFLRKDPASIVREYAPLNCLVSPEEESQLTCRSISKDTLKQFLQHMLNQLKHSADFTNTIIPTPTLHKPINSYGVLKVKLLTALSSALEKIAHCEDTLAIEQQVVISVNTFWEELSKRQTLNAHYIKAFKALMHEDMFNTPEKSAKWTVAKLRYLALQHVESTAKHTIF